MLNFYREPEERMTEKVVVVEPMLSKGWRVVTKLSVDFSIRDENRKGNHDKKCEYDLYQ